MMNIFILQPSEKGGYNVGKENCIRNNADSATDRNATPYVF